MQMQYFKGEKILKIFRGLWPSKTTTRNKIMNIKKESEQEKEIEIENK